MVKFRKIATGVAALALAGIGLPAGAQTTTPVNVSLTNVGGSRVISVEDMAGNNLASTGINFGTNRSVPFRVRVADSVFNRQTFSVSATMTNLYLDNDGSPSYSDLVPSSSIELNRQVPLNVLDVTATVQPLVDTVTTVADGALCMLLGLGAAPCNLTTTGVVGKVQELTVPVDLDDLSNLPLLPQANDTGAFTNAEYGAGTAGFDDPEKTGKPAATPKTLINGAPVADAAVLTGLNSALTTLANEVGRTGLVTDQAVLNALVQKYSALSGVAGTILNGLLGTTEATVQSLVPAQVLAQSGTYITLPKLDVTVPSGTVAGDYKGTLVVTAIQ